MIANAIRFIIGGGVVIYPTETVYGLGANALDEQAVMKVFQIKKRPHTMPLFLAVSSLRMLEKVAEINNNELNLLDQLLPGPVSVLVRKKSVVPDLLTSGSSIVGIRFPDHDIAVRIIDKTGPITSTSANRTGSPAPTSAKEVSREIADQVDLLIDGGKSKYSEPSTLVDLASRKIIRPGAGLDKVLEVIS